MATSITVITGAYPTDTPTVLTSAKAMALTGAYTSVDVAVRVSLGTGTVTLIAWHPQIARWLPVGDVALDVSVAGGMALGRFAVGVAEYSHVGVWEKTAGATVETAHLIEMRR